MTNANDEIAKLKEELVYLKELNNGLDYCAEQESIKSKQLKAILDEIKEYVNSYDTPEYGYPWHNKLKAILGEK